MARVSMPSKVQGDRLLNQAQDNIHTTLRDITQYERIKGSRILGLVLTTTPQTIQHGLGRCPIGWEVTDKTSAGDPYRTAWDERTISLRVASGTLACDVYVY